MSVLPINLRVEDDVLPVIESGAFVKGFKPPTYLWDGILQRGFCYSFTAATGAGKTAIALRLLASVALGRELAGRHIEQGNALMLAGENADDVRARWIALSVEMGFDADAIHVAFIPKIFDIDACMGLLHKTFANLEGGLALTVVDTGAAYFLGNEDNNNVEMGDHARMLRRLSDLPGRPCVVANTHPVKNAGPDNLLPRGGGAFLNEVDGNLTGRKTDNLVELHWQGKFRGPDFTPVHFELQTVTNPFLVNSKGEQMPSVVARPISELEREQKASAANKDLRTLLKVMKNNAGASLSGLAEAAGWFMGKTRDPYKSKVVRLMDELHKQKLVRKELDTWILTGTGESAAQ